jgi:rhodanese-related sulfurtransferase
MLKKIFLITVLSLFLININACAQQADETNITAKQLKEKMQTDSSLVILDVRTPQELTGILGQIDGVINIPVQELGKRVGELEKYKNKDLVVICRSGNRSAVATKFLNEKGFKAKNILGGMKAYRESEK